MTTMIKPRTPRQLIAIGEELMWQQIKTKRIFGLSFVRQYPFYLLRGDGERVVYMADFFCHEAGVVIRVVNCDAITIESAEVGAWAKTQLELRGMLVIELQCNQISDVKQVLELVKQEIKYKGRQQHTAIQIPEKQFAEMAAH